MDKAKLKKILSIVAVALGVVALIMLFLPQVKLSAMGMSENYNGIKTTFGNKDDGFKFAFGNLLTYIFVIAGIVLAIMAMLGKGGKILPIVGGALFVVAGIFFFCTVKFVAVEGGSAAKKVFEEFAKLGVGAILGGIVAILGGASLVVSAFMNE